LKSRARLNAYVGINDQMLINQKDFEAPENFSVEVAEADDI